MSDTIASPGLTKLLHILAAKTKSSLKKHCAEAIISENDLAELIMAGLAGHLDPFCYARHFSDWMPPDAPPSQKQMAALLAHREGTFPPEAQSAIHRLTNMAKSRRLYAAHLFYLPSGERWRLIYFNQRDRSRFGNHWEHGEHIHITSEHFTQLDLDSVWSAACASKPNPPKGLHVRYTRTDG